LGILAYLVKGLINGIKPWDREKPLSLLQTQFDQRLILRMIDEYLAHVFFTPTY
jgi:hypothetical protein